MFLSSLSDAQQKAFLCLAYNVVVSDGDLTVGEELMMEEMRREMNVDPDFTPEYIELEGIEEIFVDRKSRVTVLIALIQLGYADGAFEVEEQSFLLVLCEYFEISPADFALIDNWVKRLINLQKEAKDFM
jgi:tellurite resistance protein